MSLLRSSGFGLLAKILEHGLEILGLTVTLFLLNFLRREHETVDVKPSLFWSAYCHLFTALLLLGITYNKQDTLSTAIEY